jgi:hypothetical protein
MAALDDSDSADFEDEVDDATLSEPRPVDIEHPHRLSEGRTAEAKEPHTAGTQSDKRSKTNASEGHISDTREQYAANEVHITDRPIDESEAHTPLNQIPAILRHVYRHPDQSATKETTDEVLAALHHLNEESSCEKVRRFRVVACDFIARSLSELRGTIPRVSDATSTHRRSDNSIDHTNYAQHCALAAPRIKMDELNGALTRGRHGANQLCQAHVKALRGRDHQIEGLHFRNSRLRIESDSLRQANTNLRDELAEARKQIAELRAAAKR